MAGDTKVGAGEPTETRYPRASQVLTTLEGTLSGTRIRYTGGVAPHSSRHSDFQVLLTVHLPRLATAVRVSPLLSGAAASRGRKPPAGMAAAPDRGLQCRTGN
ncbi:hypothetical protein GCM10023167_27320 [Brevibacterium pityocampae]|uniref:Uncharacterized protein n=1 Tax=Brevibacterium pityocampae TaxID=506594 RepID=A0ABP8JUB1_9MICO